MDPISYSLAAKQGLRIEKFIENPDSTSGVLTQPSIIATGEIVTIPAGRTAIMANTQIDGTLVIDGDVFIPSGATFDDLEVQIASKVSKVASTDNAIVRFNGTTGNVQNSGVIIDDSGNLLLTSGTGGIGYGTGAGGTVTQLTSKSTAVTLNKPSGRITMHNEALAAGASVLFVLNNSIIDSGDMCKVSLVGGITSSNNYRIEDIQVASGAATIRVTNIGGVSRSEALLLSYSIIKGATA